MNRNRSEARRGPHRMRPSISEFLQSSIIIPENGNGALPAGSNQRPSDGNNLIEDVVQSRETHEPTPSTSASTSSVTAPLGPSDNHRQAGSVLRKPNRRQQPQKSLSPKPYAGASKHEATERSTNSSASYGHGLRQSSNTTGIKPQWADWERICLRIHNLPSNITTRDIWTVFKGYGEVVTIELFERKNTGERDGSGRVHFRPPPTTQFWEDFMIVNIRGKPTKIKVELQKEQPLLKVQAASGHSYSSLIHVKMDSLQFGVLAHENGMIPLRTIQSNSRRHGFSLDADLQHKRLEIVFACRIQDPRRKDPSIQHPDPIGKEEVTQEYKAQIPFAHLKKIIFVDFDEGMWALVIPLPTPPAFYVKHDLAGSHSDSKTIWSIRDAWDRTVDITYDTTWFKNDPVSLPRTNQFIDIGRWTVYRLIFPKSALPNWAVMKPALQDFNIKIDYKAPGEFSTVTTQVPSFWSKLEPQRPSNLGPNSNLSLLADTEDIHLPYNVRYQLEACISQGFLNEVDITTEFLQRLADLSKDHTRRRDRANDLLMYISQPRTGSRLEDRDKLDEKRIYDPMKLFKDKRAMSHYPEISLPENTQWMRKVVVTPTTLYLTNPAPEAMNRVLRQFSKYHDRFIRVQFTDEISRGRIFPTPGSVQDNALFNRIHRTLSNGIRIGGRHFEYLAAGNSQFRENGAYFFCPDDFLTCDSIRNWMGDVTHIRIVAKYAARLGQCFSTTKLPRSSPIGQTIVQIPDIEHNGWCFTDGVGKIAPSRAKFLIQNLNTSNIITHIPAVFQFRLGGSKGILTQWPEVPFNEVHLRPSQNKFNCSSQGLEIIKTSRFSVATLNRQTIMILSCLGVPDFVFERRMKKQIADYESAMENPHVAMRLLSKYVDQNGVSTTIAQMIADGFMRTKEPFFMTILEVWRAWSMRLLREKARILIDQGAFVFGCVDETRTLRGYSEPKESTESTEPRNKKDPSTLAQIFLQVPKTGIKPGETGDYTVITGICMLGRNPSLHPGDIRVVEAVDVPALRHLRDVVVFPAVGDRDIPSMCSGGDLDGDDYFVVWDPELIPPEWNYPPMEQDVLKPKALKRDVRVSDLISFFVQYMKNDSLSTIAHAHLAKCDMLTEGPKDPQCIDLARLHSKSVDYPKTGQEAHLKPSMRPRRFPHFMEKAPNKTYHSKKILGRLYDRVAKVGFKPKLDGDFDERILRRYALKDDTLKAVRMIKRQHDKAMKQIMNQHDIQTEFETWSTFVLSKPRVGSEYRRQEIMEPVMTSHRERFREACVKLAGSRDPKSLYPVIAAAYLVTWEEVQIVLGKVRGEDREQDLANYEIPLISFPWVFDYELGRIATSEEQFELEEVPKPTMGLLDDDVDNDDEEFERLVGAGIIAGEGDDKSDSSRGQETSPLAISQTLEELVVLEEDEDTSMDALARLGLN
ncbi:RdRP-domain-containing protein [Annulohypoxylon maeteangense]|uniref:RdRP-domain-containing protein n=1 Tax=Annulohypoxylon maeteangense TaxID=1927788 RepID=UPI002007BD49|nr:RdRP-domain-containing protein [Annulohypoxylon maeteangense]KAI0883835.1 RdRP-domain-containing protein [Annulohypoxylon maeteangense]